MSELLPPPPPPPPPPHHPTRRGCGFGDPALFFPEFAAKQRGLERVIEEDGEGEDSSYGKGSFDLSSRFSSPCISRNGFDDVDNNPRKLPPSGLREESSSSGFREDEEADRSRNSGSFVDRIGQEEEEDKRLCASGCFRKCCAWTCMFVSIVLVIVLLTGLTVNTSIKSKLPQVLVMNLKFSRLDVVKSSTDLLMNANLNTVLQLSNQNDKTVLYYSPMKADVSSENINLGKKTLHGFKQDPGNVTSLKIPTRLRKSKVYDVDATLLTNKEKNLEAVVDVYLRGKLSFDWLGFSVHIPIVIACEEVKQSDVINGLKPTCDVRIFSQ